MRRRDFSTEGNEDWHRTDRRTWPSFASAPFRNVVSMNCAVRCIKMKRVFYIPIDRRRFFKSMALASAGFTLPGYLAEALTLTPQQTQGPFYPLPDDIPLDKDNDLARLD